MYITDIYGQKLRINPKLFSFEHEGAGGHVLYFTDGNREVVSDSVWGAIKDDLYCRW